MVTNVDIAKAVITEHFKQGRCAIFPKVQCWTTSTTRLYEGRGLSINISYYWGFFEVVGLSEEEFAEVEKYFKALNKRKDKNMNILEKAKEIIKKHYAAGTLGIFDCRNTAGDVMTTVYDEDGLTIDICYSYEYFEVFGLTSEEFNELEKYYNSL